LNKDIFSPQISADPGYSEKATPTSPLKGLPLASTRFPAYRIRGKKGNTFRVATVEKHHAPFVPALRGWVQRIRESGRGLEVVDTLKPIEKKPERMLHH
jgi:hypothetical protein